MSKMLTVRVDDGEMELLRGRAAAEGKPVGQVVKAAVRAYLGNGHKAEGEVPKTRSEWVRREDPAEAEGTRVCRCHHAERVHTNTAVTSGTGCSWAGCACRGFRPEGV